MPIGTASIGTANLAATGGGIRGLGIWRYRTETTATPTAGRLQFDNTTIDSATNLYINATNDGGTDMTVFLSLIASGNLVYIQIQDDSSQFVVVEVDTSSLAGGVFTFPILNVEGQGTAPANNTEVAVVTSSIGDPTVNQNHQKGLYEGVQNSALIQSDFTESYTHATGVIAVAAGLFAGIQRLANDQPEPGAQLVYTDPGKNYALPRCFSVRRRPRKGRSQPLFAAVVSRFDWVSWLY